MTVVILSNKTAEFKGPALGMNPSVTRETYENAPCIRSPSGVWGPADAAVGSGRPRMIEQSEKSFTSLR